ncbi:MAG TPA: hypothetical protein ENJ28_04310 [Gammaproteobacteria bacterium]|nr:hypothetical protein [Gammaproteobacteria bacterium]
MNLHLIRYSTALFFVLLLQGCIPSYQDILVNSDTEHKKINQGIIQVGYKNSSPLAGLQKDIEEVISNQSFSEMSYQTMFLENLVNQYGSHDGRFEQAVYCALAISYLEQGKRPDFLRTAELLSTYLTDKTYLTPEIQYVMDVYQVMSGTDVEYKGIGHNKKMQQVINDLIQL